MSCLCCQDLHLTNLEDAWAVVEGELVHRSLCFYFSPYEVL